MSVKVINNLMDAYDVYNKAFFDNKLTDCIITLGKKANAFGVYMPNRWIEKNPKKTINPLVENVDIAPEIRMVPTTFKNRTTKEILSTLAHEQVHHWRATLCEKPKRKRGHDKYWAQKMEEIGLMPYNIKNPEKKTGYQCSHNIIPGGLFDQITNELITNGLEIKYYFNDKSTKKYKPRIKKVKYICNDCETEIFGTMGLSIQCNECETNFEEAA